MSTDSPKINDQKSPYYGHYTTSEVIELLIRMMLDKAYRSHPKNDDHKELNRRVKKAWAERYNEEYMPARNISKLAVPLLNGSSGIGKTEGIRAAYAQVAEMLDLNLFVSPKGRAKFGPFDMVVGNLNLKATGDIPGMVAGMMSVQEIDMDDGTTQTFTTFIPNDVVYSVSAAAGAGVSILYLDEATSGPMANAALHGIIDNSLSSNIELKDVFFVSSGNLGEEDGNMASVQPAANSTRCSNMMVMADYQTWYRDYHAPQYLSEGRDDYGVGLYLAINRDNFSMKPPKASELEGTSCAYATPRTWEKLVVAFDVIYRSPEKMAEAGIDHVANTAQTLIGVTGKHYAEFAYNLWTGVVPLVNAYMSDEGPNKENRADYKKIIGTGAGAIKSDNALRWTYQIGATSASILASKLEQAGLDEPFTDSNKTKNDKAEAIFSDVGKRIGTALSELDKNSLVTKSVADLADHIEIILLSQMPFLEEKGYVRSNLRHHLSIGISEKLLESGRTSEQVKLITGPIFTNDSDLPNRPGRKSPAEIAASANTKKATANNATSPVEAPEKEVVKKIASATPKPEDAANDKQKSTSSPSGVVPL